MTKKQSIVLAVLSFLVGVTVGVIFAPKNGKVTINGDNNIVRTGLKSFNGNHNGCSNNKGYRVREQ